MNGRGERHAAAVDGDSDRDGAVANPDGERDGAPSTAITTDGDLRRGFDAFVAAARRLERSYAELKARAAAVDLQLAHTNATLQRTLAERETILGALPIGVLARDGGGTVVWSNPEGDRLRHLAADCGVDLLATPDGDVQRDPCILHLRRARLPDGELLLLEDRAQVTHLRREVDRLDRLAGLSELALGIAHEIKNPLNGIMGFAALMERTSDGPTLCRFAGKVVEGLRQVDAIVRALLAFARPASRESRPASVERVVLDAATAAGLPRARLALHGDAQEPCEATVLGRVLQNLVQNSVEAAAGVTVTVEARTAGDELRLDVTDDGPGVPASLAPRIFEPFVSSKERGHGLGLALSARVLGFLGGAVELLNPGERGARFRVRVPRLAPSGVAADTRRGAESTPVGPGCSTLAAVSCGAESACAVGRAPLP